MSDVATYEQGHLVVAGIRVLENRHNHPPTEEDLAELLGMSREWVGVLIRSLADTGVVHLVESAFTLRVEVRNHLALEELTKEKDVKPINQELEEFNQKRKKDEEALSDMFGGGFLKKQEDEMNEMADKLKSFKQKKSKPNPLFDPDE